MEHWGGGPKQVCTAKNCVAIHEDSSIWGGFGMVSIAQVSETERFRQKKHIKKSPDRGCVSVFVQKPTTRRRHMSPSYSKARRRHNANCAKRRRTA